MENSPRVKIEQVSGEEVRQDEKRTLHEPCQDQFRRMPLIEVGEYRRHRTFSKASLAAVAGQTGHVVHKLTLRTLQERSHAEEIPEGHGDENGGHLQ